MARAVRPAKRPFNSPAADVAAWALQELAPEQFSVRKQTHWMVLRDWHAAVAGWKCEHPDFWLPNRWDLMRSCDSSLLWTPRLVAATGCQPKSRFCCQRWLCPFCYGREVVTFLRPFVQRNFQIHTDVLTQAEPEAIWSQFQATSVKLNQTHGAVASWRYAYKTAENFWIGRGAWLFPGPHTFAELSPELAAALAYPSSILSCSMDYLAP